MPPLGLRKSRLAWVGNYHLHLEKTLVTQLGGDATYALGTGRELGPWPASGQGGSALGMSMRVPRAVQERAQHGSRQLLLPPSHPSALLCPWTSVSSRVVGGSERGGA